MNTVADSTIHRTLNGHTVAWTPAQNPEVSLTPHPQPLGEAQCSVNLFFEVSAGYGKAQATGRGQTAQEAAANLKATIDATRAALAPAPLAPRIERLAALLACGTAKALQAGNTARLDRLARAYLLVVKGMVEAVTMDGAQTGAYEVQSQTVAGTRYFVEGQSCACQDAKHHADDPAWWCAHSLAALYVFKMDAQEAEVL